MRPISFLRAKSPLYFGCRGLLRGFRNRRFQRPIFFFMASTERCYSVGLRRRYTTAATLRPTKRATQNTSTPTGFYVIQSVMHRTQPRGRLTTQYAMKDMQKMALVSFQPRSAQRVLVCTPSGN